MSRETYRRARLEADHLHLTDRLAHVHEVIETLRTAEPLKPDAAARLARYEDSAARISWDLRQTERAIEDLQLEESERLDYRV